MTPIDFTGANTTFAKNQPEYLPLPAQVHEDGMVTTCWALSWRERWNILWKGHLFLDVFTFHHPLQPLRPWVKAELLPWHFATHVRSRWWCPACWVWWVRETFHV